MNTQTLARQFRTIGAKLETTIWSPGRKSATMNEEYTLDIGSRKGHEVFSLVVRPDAVGGVELLAIDVQPKDRHLLLMAKPLIESGEKRKFLCGHDERHWFVAGIPKAVSVTDVSGAMEALKPQASRLSQHRAGVRGRNWNRRRNAGFLRQGEWFFLPQPDLSPNEKLILRDEPIRRSGGKPHMDGSRPSSVAIASMILPIVSPVVATNGLSRICVRYFMASLLYCRDHRNDQTKRCRTPLRYPARRGNIDPQRIPV